MKYGQESEIESQTKNKGKSTRGVGSQVIEVKKKK